jgi:hypothetical protein
MRPASISDSITARSQCRTSEAAGRSSSPSASSTFLRSSARITLDEVEIGYGLGLSSRATYIPRVVRARDQKLDHNRQHHCKCSTTYWTRSENPAVVPPCKSTGSPPLLAVQVILGHDTRPATRKYYDCFGHSAWARHCRAQAFSATFHGTTTSGSQLN